ncbi:MAG: hypothetical protein HOE90_04345 [Bacteriovoracaceae bacterium]|jgi:very-long-chain (3R)-3-hydroxyacyl-CoA dehydratase|nr:hypothetical protein [Bacteriovoracaceae bacterium]
MYLKTYNFSMMVLWLLTLGSSIYALLGFESEFFTPLTLVRITHLVSLLEIFHCYKKWVKSSLSFTIIQVLARNLYAWVIFYAYLQNQGDPRFVVALIFVWSLADSLRSGYYFFGGRLLGFFRYNLFIILYPIGQISEIVMCSLIMKYSPSPLRWLLAPLVVSYFVFGKGIFQYLYKNRQRYFQNLN